MQFYEYPWSLFVNSKPQNFTQWDFPSNDPFYAPHYCVFCGFSLHEHSLRFVSNKINCLLLHSRKFLKTKIAVSNFIVKERPDGSCLWHFLKIMSFFLINQKEGQIRVLHNDKIVEKIRKPKAVTFFK